MPASQQPCRQEGDDAYLDDEQRRIGTPWTHAQPNSESSMALDLDADTSSLADNEVYITDVSTNLPVSPGISPVRTPSGLRCCAAAPRPATQWLLRHLQAEFMATFATQIGTVCTEADHRQDLERFSKNGYKKVRWPGRYAVARHCPPAVPNTTVRRWPSPTIGWTTTPSTCMCASMSGTSTRRPPPPSRYADPAAPVARHCRPPVQPCSRPPGALRWQPQLSLTPCELLGSHAQHASRHERFSAAQILPWKTGEPPLVLPPWVNQQLQALLIDTQSKSTIQKRNTLRALVDGW